MVLSAKSRNMMTSHRSMGESNCHDAEVDEETTIDFGESRSSTWRLEDPKTPPPRRSQSVNPFHPKLMSRSRSPTACHMLPSNEELIAEQKAAALALLNQLDVWKVGDKDFKQQQTQSRFSLALDGIADVTPESAFSRSLPVAERILANAICVKSINEQWQSLSSILSRVCGQCYSYDQVFQASRKEDVNEPVVDYLRAIIYSYSHYLESHEEVSRNINEREGFGDLTWSFIRGALKLVKIPSRCFEIPMIGTKERRNVGRDLYVETEEQAPMADGVALFGDHQIYLAEASLIYEPKLDKEVKDKFKLVRCMRDSWNSQIKSISREAVPPIGLTVFGSTSFGDETKFYAMDFAGTYRLRQ
ncbi:hypothetical protein BGZ95_005588, partial [Linnemannia exigua]